MEYQAKPEHQLLLKMLGDWNAEGSASMGPDKSPTTWKSKESVRSIGKLWILAEGQGATPEGEATTTLMVLGYDDTKKRYVGSFVASIMSYLWVYEGSADPSEKVLTLDTRGPSMADDGTSADYQDVIEFVSSDERTMTSFAIGNDGQRTEVMKIVYRRAAQS